MKLSQWHKDCKPVHVGLYQILHVGLYQILEVKEFLAWSWWDGDKWGLAYTKKYKENAIENRDSRSFNQNKTWRGIVK